ncbi:PASTA domain-containing protein [Micromonospora sp. CPCC 206061]|uniref:PASTA domain-containing protein n=1 Tax=Micromonospora sp. CPCC 206061 TaxID=3122410 RepID=UPI002FEF4A6D
MADDRDEARSGDETEQFDPFADDVDEPPGPGGADTEAADERTGPDATAPLPAPDETAPMSAVAPDETAPMAAAKSDETAPMAAVDETAPIPTAGGAWSGRAGVPPPDATAIRGPVPPDWEPVPEDERRWWMPILLGIIALLLLGMLIVGVWLIMRADDSGAGDETPAPTASVVPTTAAAPTTAAPATSAPATATSGPVSIEVPQVVGLTQADAQAQLDAAGLPYRLEFRPSDRPAGTVIDTDPAGGRTVPEGTQVVLVIAESAPTSAPPTSAPTSEAARPSPTS